MLHVSFWGSSGNPNVHGGLMQLKIMFLVILRQPLISPTIKGLALPKMEAFPPTLGEKIEICHAMIGLYSLTHLSDT